MPSCTDKLALVVKDDLVEELLWSITSALTGLAMRAEYTGDMWREGAQQGDNTEHIAQLIVLPYDKDAGCRSGIERRDRPGAGEESKDGNKEPLQAAFKGADKRRCTQGVSAGEASSRRRAASGLQNPHPGCCQNSPRKAGRADATVLAAAAPRRRRDNPPNDLDNPDEKKNESNPRKKTYHRSPSFLQHGCNTPPRTVGTENLPHQIHVLPLVADKINLRRIHDEEGGRLVAEE